MLDVEILGDLKLKLTTLDPSLPILTRITASSGASTHWRAGGDLGGWEGGSHRHSPDR